MQCVFASKAAIHARFGGRAPVVSVTHDAMTNTRMRNGARDAMAHGNNCLQEAAGSDSPFGFTKHPYILSKPIIILGYIFSRLKNSTVARSRSPRQCVRQQEVSQTMLHGFRTLQGPRQTRREAFKLARGTTTAQTPQGRAQLCARASADLEGERTRSAHRFSARQHFPVPASLE